MTALFAVKTRVIIALLAVLSFSSKAQLTANFSATPLSGCAPMVVNFTDLSTGSPAQWRWDLGNGTTSFNQNPSGTYFNPGQYTVKLVITNAAGTSDSITKTQYITIYSQPTVAFTGIPLAGCFPLTVQFTDQSIAGSGSINFWQWDFGDGASSALQNPVHTYAISGNYNVTLRVSNSLGCITVLTKVQYIQVNPGAHADFSNTNPVSCNPPATINFQNLSTGPGTLNYQWSFGDGGSSVLTNPSHIYAIAGTYTVRLIAINSFGCRDTIVKTNLIVVGNIHASFISADSVCVNNTINFTNTSVPVPTAVLWNFGDGTTSPGMSPVKQYALPGTYIVKLISFFGACSDSAFKTIVVKTKPTALFTASPLSSCSAPLTVNFVNQSVSGISYNWDFGDGSTSPILSPSHTYSTFGSFSVTLIVTNSSGCTDTIRKPNYIIIQAPTVAINNLPIKACAPLTHTFTAPVTSLAPVLTWLWDFGDGTTSALASPTHTFPVGVYDIRLTITTAGGCTATTLFTAGVTVSTKPVANFTANPRDVCAHVPVNFTDLSTGTISTWQWTFGDGGTSTSQNPVHVYEDTGYFNVQLIISNNGCDDTIKFVNYIHINPPIANFANTFSCSNPETQVFTDMSIGADSWSWDFGDGNTSTVPSPVHTYAGPGVYTVSLLVSNFTTGCTYTKQSTVTIVNEKANFNAVDSVICKNVAVRFNAIGNIPLNVVSYNWTFGDGGTGTGSNPSHTYTQAGQFSVRLIITDIIGCSDTLLKTLYIEVDGPTANFTATTPGSCLMSAISFNDMSASDGTHPITTWIWNYGDGIIETLTTPPFQHTYAGPGVYTITLTVVDSKGCIDSIVKTNAITISKPVAAFSSLDTISCPGKNVHFTDASAGPGLNYTWDFGDGTSSIASNPVHAYAADGVYTVKLVIVDQYGCGDTIIKPNYISILSPHAVFSISDSIATCPPLFVTFTNSSANYTTMTWKFGDGTSTNSNNPSHFYSVPGIYHPTLVVTSQGGCVDSFQKQIIVRGPLGTFTYGPLGGCKPLTINFTATTHDRLSFIWDFNDGNISSGIDSVISHTYTVAGAYIPKMILIDAGGCQVPITGPDTIFVKGVVANFNFVNQPICDAGSISFTDASVSNDPVVSYAWKFGDGVSSAVQNPTHFYPTTGIYFPQLIVTTQRGCKDTANVIAPVKIVASPQADFTNSANGCAPLTVTYNGLLNVPDTSVINWAWDFGNGNTSGLQHPPPQLYTNPTTYAIQLIATNSTGCKDTVNKTINAFLVPTINAGADTLVCRGSGVGLNASGAASYTWTPAAGLSCTNCANPVASPDSITTYIVRGTTLLGCSNTDTVLVKVKQPFIMTSSPGDTLCKGGSLRLFANGAYAYTWSPATALSSTTSAAPLASPSTTTTYRVIGVDDRGCFKDTNFVTVRVFPIPTVEAGKDKTINVGQTVDLMPAVSADVTSVTWQPTTNIVHSSFPGITVKPNETTQYSIEVKNPGGCKSKDIVTVFVVCDGANVFIPNTFSPNGDGVNDIFYPRGTGLFTVKTFRVFNRWGEVVYEKNGFMPNDPSAGWNGTHNGQKLTPDVYVYTIQILCNNNSVLTFKGNVALIQ